MKLSKEELYEIAKKYAPVSTWTKVTLNPNDTTPNIYHVSFHLLIDDMRNNMMLIKQHVTKRDYGEQEPEKGLTLVCDIILPSTPEVYTVRLDAHTGAYKGRTSDAVHAFGTVATTYGGYNGTPKTYNNQSICTDNLILPGFYTLDCMDTSFWGGIHTHINPNASDTLNNGAVLCPSGIISNATNSWMNTASNNAYAALVYNR